jgi:hypothetical protein
VLPLREGGSVPALVEAEDMGMYVVKLRGAGQGPKALVAELVAGELARAVGLAVPEVVLVEMDRAIADSEPDPELAQSLEASAGINVGLDYLPGSITFDPVADPAPGAELASRIVLFDALVLNVDRTARNPNILSWHRRLWLIDHGACLYFHHGWGPADRLASSGDPFPEVRHHVLLRSATADALGEAAVHMNAMLDDGVVARVISDVPGSLLEDDRAFAGPSSQRDAYLEWLRARRAAIPVVLEEAQRARAELV